MLFKRVNDQAKKSIQSGRELTEQEFIQLFLITKIDPSSNDDLITVFEILDRQGTGMIKANDLAQYLLFTTNLRGSGWKSIASKEER